MFAKWTSPKSHLCTFQLSVPPTWHWQFLPECHLLSAIPLLINLQGSLLLIPVRSECGLSFQVVLRLASPYLTNLAPSASDPTQPLEGYSWLLQASVRAFSSGSNPWGLDHHNLGLSGTARYYSLYEEWAGTMVALFPLLAPFPQDSIINSASLQQWDKSFTTKVGNHMSTHLL